MSVLDRFALTDKTVLVTGASSGLGVVIARVCAQAGANLVLGARRVDRLADTVALVEQAGRRAVAVSTDVVDPEQCTALVQAGVDAFGGIDVLVNNAGVADSVPATKEDPDRFRGVVDINLCGSYWMAQACARVMQPGSSIVNISSVLALTSVGLPQASYSASKAAVIALTRDLAQQWSGRKGIRVNALAPGFFASEMTEDFDPDYAQRVLSRVPLNRYGDGEELAATVVFLASAASAYITGVVLPVDGGLLTT